MNVAQAHPVAPMRPRFTAAVYVGVLVLFVGVVAGVLEFGRYLEPATAALASASASTGRHAGGHWPLMLLQVAIILAVSRAFGWAVRRVHQPQVVGEIMAGILLGPSFFGWVAPGLSSALFPVSSLNLLAALSQIGLTLFMFLVGLELDLTALRSKSHTAVITSHVGIILPFVLGCISSLCLYSRLAPPQVPFAHFALFVGISMSITAFPVLARILSERRMLDTPIGAVTLACAAVDDITAWCLLAGVVALVRTDAALPLWFTLGGSALFCAVMILAVRPLLSHLSRRSSDSSRIGEGALAFMLLLLLLSASITEYLGIHALFGSFLIGAIMPRHGTLVAQVSEKVNHLSVVLLLPIFFALTGLRTDVGALATGDMWMFALLILGAAVLGKFGGSLLSGRLTGSTWHDAAMLGALMNTRGLMEIVVLNVGYDIGILSKPLFAMMISMALITTMMTTPVLAWLDRQKARIPVGVGAARPTG